MVYNANIFKERGRWHYRYKIQDEFGNTNYRKKGGYTTKANASRAYKTYLLLQEDIKIDCNMPLGDYIKLWLNEISQFTGSTYSVYSYVLEKTQLDLNQVSLSCTTSEYIKTILLNVTAQTPSYGEKLYEFLNMALGYAYYNQIIDFSPMKFIHKPTRAKVKITQYSEKELKHLIEGARYSDWYLEILLTLSCGLRRGEVYGLKFADFNIEKKTIFIRHQIVHNRRGADDKLRDEDGSTDNLSASSGVRILSVPAEVLYALGERRRKIAYQKENFLSNNIHYEDNDYVSCQANGKQRAVAALNTALTRLCKKQGLPCITPQGLRDMYAIIMLTQAKISFVILKGLMGYATIESIYERYAHLADPSQAVLHYANQIYSVEEII